MLKDKKLVKNSKNKKVNGVLSGVSDYLAVDPNLVRLFLAIAMCFSGFFILAVIYFIADWVLPYDYEVKKEEPQQAIPVSEPQPENEKQIDL